MIGFSDDEALRLVFTGTSIGDKGEPFPFARPNHREIASVRGYRNVFNLRPGGEILDGRRGCCMTRDESEDPHAERG